MAKRKRARVPAPRRPYAGPVPGELAELLGPLGFSAELVTHLEDQAAAAAEQGVEFRAVIDSGPVVWLR